MKKIILLVFISLVVASCRNYTPASGNPDYRPLKEFNKDTLAYFNYNFQIHKDFYIGKRFSVLVNDVENDPKSWFSDRYVKKIKKKCITSTSLFTEPEVNAAEQYDDCMEVYFADTSYVNVDDFWEREKLIKKLNPDVSLADLHRNRRDFLSDCVVSDISVDRIDMRKSTLVRQEEKHYWEYLQCGKWERFCDYKKLNDRQTVRFTKDSVYFQEGDVKNSKSYYLTWKRAEKVTEFKDENVGNKDEWRTIVVKDQDGSFRTFTIFEISNDILKLREYKTKELWYFRKAKDK